MSDANITVIKKNVLSASLNKTFPSFLSAFHGLHDYQQYIFYTHDTTYSIIHTTVFVVLIVEHWLEREEVQNKVQVHHRGALFTEINPAPHCSVVSGSKLHYFSFQPEFHEWFIKGRGMCYSV